MRAAIYVPTPDQLAQVVDQSSFLVVLAGRIVDPARVPGEEAAASVGRQARWNASDLRSRCRSRSYDRCRPGRPR